MANRYWVGGTANWDATAGTKWATTSGGAGGAAVPTASDDVFFDAASGTVTCTVSGSRVCNNIDFTGFTGTFAGTGGVTVSGNLLLISGMTYSHTGGFTMNATTTGKTITSAGKTLASLSLNGAGGEWTLQDNITCSGIFSVGNGSLVTGNKNITASQLQSSNSNTRSIALGSSTITVTGTTPLSITSTNLTWNAGTSLIKATSATPPFGVNNGSPLTYYDYEFTNCAPTSLAAADTFHNLTINGRASKYDSITVQENQTITGTLTIAGNSATNRIWITTSSDVFPSKTFTAAVVALSNIDFTSITAAGAAAPFTGTSLGDMGNNTNITTTTPVTRYWIGGTGSYSDTSHWSATSGGSGGASVPLCHDTVVFDASSFSANGQVCTFDMDRVGTITASAVDQTVTFLAGVISSSILYITGSVTLNSSITLDTATNSVEPTMFIFSSKTFNQNGATFSTDIFHIYAVDVTLSLSSNFAISATGNVNLRRGTFDANDFNVLMGGFQSFDETDGELDRIVYMGAGTWTFPSSENDTYLGGGIWQSDEPDVGFTLHAETSLILLTDTSEGQKSFITDFNNTGHTTTLYNFTIDPVVNNSTIDFSMSGNLVFNNFTAINPAAQYFISFGLYTYTFNMFNVRGSEGKTIIIDGAGQSTLSKSSGIVNCDYIEIDETDATGGAIWYAGANSIDNENNTGWLFSSAIRGMTMLGVG